MTNKTLKEALAKFYFDKIDEETSALWEKGVISLEKLEEIKHSHLRASTGK